MDTCEHHEEIRDQLAEIFRRLDAIDKKASKIMSALTDLQAADEALKAEVAKFLADIAAALQAEDPDIEAVVTDLNEQVASLQGADPASPPAGN